MQLTCIDKEWFEVQRSDLLDKECQWLIRFLLMPWVYDFHDKSRWCRFLCGYYIEHLGVRECHLESGVKYSVHILCLGRIEGDND